MLIIAHLPGNFKKACVIFRKDATFFRTPSSQERKKTRIGGFIMCARRIRPVLCLLLAALLLFGGSALAAQPDDSFYDVGREALLKMASGDVDGAVARIGFSFDPNDSTYSEDGFRQIVSDKYAPYFDEEPTLQATAVAFYMDDLWYLALPVSEPDSDRMETFVLISPDQATFTGYAALSWSTVQEMSDMADECYWNVEYNPVRSVPMADE